MNSSPPLARRDFLGRACVAGAALASGALTPTTPAAEAAKPRFQYIAFSKPFQTLSPDDTADVVAEVGFDGIECPVRPKGQIEPERAAEELPRLAAALKQRGKEITMITTAIKSVSEPHTETVLRAAAKSGIKRYRLGFWKYDAKRPIPAQLAEIGAQLRDLAALNQELGLQAGFQNHSGRDYVGAPIWDVWTMIKDFDPRHLGVCFDIGHATLEGGMSWPIESRLMQPHFSVVYVKDFRWEKAEKGWRAVWVPLGEGMVDKTFFTWLKTTPYTGPISQHHEYDHGQGKPMIARMRKDLQVLKEWMQA